MHQPCNSYNTQYHSGQKILLSVNTPSLSPSPYSHLFHSTLSAVASPVWKRPVQPLFPLGVFWWSSHPRETCLWRARLYTEPGCGDELLVTPYPGDTRRPE